MYCIDSSVDEPIMLLNKFIGGYNEEDGWGVDGAQFQRELLELDNLGKKSIMVYINCPGGDVIQGMNIFNAILHSKTPVDTCNTGLAASMGAAIWMAGRKRFIADYAKTMIHNPSGGDDKDAINAFTDSVCTMTASKCSLSEDEVRAMMKNETWLNADECKEKGFATDIIETSEKNKKYMAAPRAMYQHFSKIAANIFKTENTNNMKKITAHFKLNDDANEDSVLEAVKGIEAKLATSEGSLTTANARVAQLENELTAAKLQATELAATAADAAEADLVEKATAMVNGFAKAGRIQNKPETITKWVALAKVDMEGTKKMIEELPLNKVAKTIETETPGEGVKITAQVRMIQIAAKHKQ